MQPFQNNKHHVIVDISKHYQGTSAFMCFVPCLTNSRTQSCVSVDTHNIFQFYWQRKQITEGIHTKNPDNIAEKSIETIYESSFVLNISLQEE